MCDPLFFHLKLLRPQIRLRLKMLRASKEASKLLASGSARQLLELPLPVFATSFETAASRGDLDAFVVLCHIRAQALDRFVDGRGNSIKHFERAELPYRIFCIAVESGNTELLQWMLDHHVAVGMRVRGVDAFSRAARKDRLDIMKWILDNRDQLASANTERVTSYVALRTLVRSKLCKASLWFIRNRVALTGAATIPENIAITFAQDPRVVALLFREGALKPESLVVKNIVCGTNVERMEPLVFRSSRVYDTVLAACRDDAPLAVELMLGRPGEIQCDHMVHRQDLVRVLRDDEDLSWLTDVFRGHLDTFVELGQVRRELERRGEGPDAVEAALARLRKIAWDPQPTMGVVVLMLASSLAHAFGSTKIKRVLDNACVGAQVPEWVDRGIRESQGAVIV